MLNIVQRKEDNRHRTLQSFSFDDLLCLCASRMITKADFICMRGKHMSTTIRKLKRLVQLLPTPSDATSQGVLRGNRKLELEERRPAHRTPVYYGSVSTFPTLFERSPQQSRSIAPVISFHRRTSSGCFSSTATAREHALLRATFQEGSTAEMIVCPMALTVAVDSLPSILPRRQPFPSHRSESRPCLRRKASSR